MESTSISVAQLRVCDYVLSHARWFTTKQAAHGARVPERSTRRHLTRLFEIGILERVHMFEGYRWHRRDTLDERAAAYMARLDELLATYARKRRTLGSTLTGLVGMLAI